MRLRNRLLILFLALWLPASVVAAGTVSVSMSGAASQELAADSGGGCPQHANQETPDRAPGDCYGCAFCQFACTALMTMMLQPPGFLQGWIAAEFSLPALSPYVLDRPQRPPLVP